MKKLSWVVTFLLAALVAQAATETVGGVERTYTVRDGKAQVGMDGTRAIPVATTGAIAIPSMLGNVPVTSIGDYAFFACDRVNSVSIPSTVTSIGPDAFDGTVFVRFWR